MHDEDLGLGLRPGDNHYRAYVGPPADYDLIANLTTSLLLCLGLRENHELLDLGCGSLRVGRLLIPYLRPGHYTGLEPNRWLVEDGIRNNLGDELVALREPHFLYNADFDISANGTSYDFVLAQSIFSHTHARLMRSALAMLRRGIRAQGVLIATYVEGPRESEADGNEWVYPAITPLSWSTVESALNDVGLAARQLDWPHPRQRWFVASPSDDVAGALAGVRRPFEGNRSAPKAVPFAQNGDS
jgi:SAM-dependent methyltransferase